MQDTILIPNLRSVFRHAIPNIVEGKVIPTLLFLGALKVAGTAPALLIALAWSLLAVARRLYQNKAVPGLLILTVLALIGKTVAALATGSLFLYLLQPTVATAVFGLAFLISVPLGKPLAERLVHDVCPFDDETRSHPALQQFLSRVTLWWALTSLINFAITLWLLLTQSPATFVLVKSVLGPCTTACTFVVAFFWFRSHMARAGLRVAFQPSLS